MTGQLDVVSEDDAMPAACCEACQDTNLKIRALHSLAEQFMDQIQSVGPMGMVAKLMSGR